MVKDPVCEMEVDEKTAKHKAEHMGKTYYFCELGCKKNSKRTPTNK
ncbi:MAG: YHS domain-containing protein [Candidatus Bathyarchaeota archaeon]|nr:YHS domain-containing protein [Candidatus Bathyarchaeota archaeon]MDH5787478.1 YHS domain-containing protein [Candidatus Bathyarchaeota archaeon]